MKIFRIWNLSPVSEQIFSKPLFPSRTPASPQSNPPRTNPHLSLDSSTNHTRPPPSHSFSLLNPPLRPRALASSRPGPAEPKLAPLRAPPPTPRTGGWNPLAALVEAPDAAATGGPRVRRVWSVGRRRWPLHGHRRGAARARGGVAPRVLAALPLLQVLGRLRVHPGLRDLRRHPRPHSRCHRRQRRPRRLFPQEHRCLC